MPTWLEILAGGVVGCGVIAAVFWFTFRNPPPGRHADDTTSINPLATDWTNDAGGHGLSDNF